MILFLLLLQSLAAFSFILPVPSDKFSYMLAREKLKSFDSGVQRVAEMSDKEKTVNLFFEKFKTAEFQETQKYFYAARPIEAGIKQIKNRTLYKMLKTVPKGGNLHIHEFQMLDRRVLLEVIMASKEYEYLHICDKDNNPDCLDSTKCNCMSYLLQYFKKPAPPGFVKVKYSTWTIDAILEKTVLTNILNDMKEKVYATDSNARWATTNQVGVFDFYGDVVKNNNTRFLYLKACLDNALNESVQLIEFRRSNFGSLWYFDADGNQVTIDAKTELNLITQFKKDYIKKNPKLIDFVFIIYSARSKTKADVLSDLRKSLAYQAEFSQLVRGFDLVGEEDAGHTLLFHSDTLIEAFNYGQKSKGTFDLIFHNAETNWPDDFLINYGDGVATMGNVYDSIILKTHRIGHGLGLVKHPNLYPHLISKEIAIEICPSSNQILGYVADLRNHPGLNYYRSGIPIVLAGDDPGSFGYDELTVEFYLAYMAWGLNLGDLKKFATNSIKHSVIPDEIRKVGFDKFNKEWNAFIDQMYVTACTKPFTNFYDVLEVLPAFGPSDRVNKVSIFGSGFERFICKPLAASFGGVITKCEVKTLNEITCDTPLAIWKNKTVTLNLKYDNKFINTKLTYNFLASKNFKIIEN